MDWLEKAWPIIQSGGAALTVAAIFAIRYLTKELADQRNQNNALTAKFIDLAVNATMIIEKNTAANAANNDLIRRVLDQAKAT